MVKKISPIFFIFLVWLIFSKPFLIDNKIPYPSDLQVNQFSLWSSYPKLLGPVKNPAQPDVISQIMPWKKLTIESLKNFQIPYWNPYSFSGTPHLANYQSSPFSITNSFYFIFNFKMAWGLAVLIQPLLAGIFTYIFARSLKRSKIASTLAAISFMFCGFITTWMSYTTLSLAISFLPLALFSIEKYYESKKTRFLILISASIPLSFFSGHFQISIYFLIFILLYISFKFYETKNIKDFLTTLIFTFFGILLSMSQILPSLELYLNTYRSTIFQKIEAVPLKYLATIIAPDYYGNPVTRNNIFNSYAEWAAFLGIIPFLLGLYALSIKSKKTIFFFLMSLIALLISIDSPILDSFVNLKIPVLSTSSTSRILVILSFSLAILSSFGLDKIQNDLLEKKYKKIFAWIFFYLSLFAFIWILSVGKVLNPNLYQISIKNMIFPTLIFIGFLFTISLSIINKKLITISLIIILILATLDMLRFANKWQPFPPNDLFKETKIITKLKSLDNTYRTIGAYGAEGSVYFGIPGTEGYDPLYINRYGEFMGSLEKGKIMPSDRSGLVLPVNSKFMPKVIDLIGIKYVLLKNSDINKTWAFPFKKYPNKFKLIYKDNEFHIFENINVYPRAFLVGDYKQINDSQKIINKILDKNFDLRKSVVLEDNPKINNNRNFKGSAEIINYLPNKIIIITNSNSDSVLVLTDNFYPGWKAKVNGKEKNIIRADFTYRGVSLPKGENTVEFYFESEYFKWGIYLAAISIFSILFIIVGKWYNEKIWIQKQRTVKSVTKSSAKIANGKQAQTKQKKFKKEN